MKALKRTIAFALTVLLLVSCLGLSAFAETDRVKQFGKADEEGYGGYLAFGDSVARGCGAQGDDLTEYRSYNHRVVPNSYPAIIAEAVGCNIINDATVNEDETGANNYWPVCLPGMTLSATMDILGIEDGYDDELGYDHDGVGGFNLYPQMEKYFGDARDWLDNKASLITIGFGLTDVVFAPVAAARANHDEIDQEFLEEALANVDRGFEYFKNAMPILLDHIKNNNPNATVVIVGCYNASGDMFLSDDFMIPVGQAATAAIGFVNMYLKQWAEEYGYIYCDITNAETYAAQYDIGLLSGFLDDTLIYSHLSVEGNAYVARKILSELPKEKPAAESGFNTDIVVDLGRFTKVDSVAVDGIILSKNFYSMDGYKLTIPWLLPTSKLLTVTSTNNGKTSIYTYQLSYNLKTGYSAYLLSGVNDVKTTATKVVTSLFSVGKNAASHISNALKRK